MESKEEKNKKELITRLRKIEGQVKGIEKMIENDASCKDVVVQIAAVRAAVNKIGGLMLKSYAKNCVAYDNICLIEDDDREKKVDDLISTLMMFVK
ncbi:metal-sensitive transcriptional regulator [Clostridium neuense]|uniref:Metal-sensitive transcriptional regulator n=1 Tax=Clostridium neuense TaxID=1728934 RepID=A0ABW8TGY1_9CLOT